MSSSYAALSQVGGDAVACGRDAFAADVIERAADDGHAGAQVFAGAVNGMLGRAYVRRQRASRLRRRAGCVSEMGYQDLASLAALAASSEDSGAIRQEALAAASMRGTHDGFGFMTDAEKKWHARKKAEAGWTTAQAEEVMSSLLDRLYASATNYGMEEGYGEDAPEPEEVGEEDIDRLDAMIDAFGGDMHLVFGDAVYGEVRDALGASQERLKKRRARLKKRLARLENKLEEKEEAGKTGLWVKLLSKRVEVLENRIEKINSKIHKVKRAGRKSEDAEAESETIRAAEDSSLKTVEGKAADAPLEDVDDIESEMEELDEFGMMSEVDVFGVTDRRRSRLLRRVARLEARLDRIAARGLNARQQRRIARVRSRIERIRAKVDQDPISERPGPSALPSYVTEDADAFTNEAYVDSLFGGSLNQAEREPFVAFFARDAERRGADPREGFGQSDYGKSASLTQIEQLLKGGADGAGDLLTKVKNRVDGRAGIRRTRRLKMKTLAENARGRVRANAPIREIRRMTRQGRRKAVWAAWLANSPAMNKALQDLQAARRRSEVNQTAPAPASGKVKATDGWATNGYIWDKVKNQIAYSRDGEAFLVTPTTPGNNPKLTPWAAITALTGWTPVA